MIQNNIAGCYNPNLSPQSAPAAGAKSETADPFLDCFVVKQSVTFDTPISMEQLAKSMTTNADGSISFNFGSIPGAHSSK